MAAQFATPMAMALGAILLTGSVLSPVIPPAIAQPLPTARQQVAVIDFSYSAPSSDDAATVDVSKGVSAKIAAALNADGTYRTVNQDRVEQTLKTLNLSGALSATDAIRVGKALGADLVLTGTITKLESGQKCTDPSSDCAAIMAQVVLETNVTETASGNTATRRSEASITRSGAGTNTQTLVLEEVVDQAIANLVKGLTENTDRVEFRRSVTPWGTEF
jgi:hypothetical protein